MHTHLIPFSKFARSTLLAVSGLVSLLSSTYGKKPEAHLHCQVDQQNQAKEIQRALALRGYYSGEIDGQLGPESQRAIACYQQARAQRITGLVNKALLRALRIA